MQRRFQTVDVFTDRRFGGNPLAVVLEAEGLDDATMQAIAREFNYSETTFVLPPRDPAHAAAVRIFTPNAELPFAGHPNIGTAFVLARLANSPAPLLFEETVGLVTVLPLERDGIISGAELTLPRPLEQGAEVEPAAVGVCLGLTARDIRTDRHRPQIASVGLPFLFAEVVDRTALARAKADAAAFARLLPTPGANGIFFYARDPADPAALQARMFSPLDGIGEDPATGSACAALAALLASHGAPKRLAIHQGIEMGRPSLLETTVTPEATRLRGNCVAVTEGFLRA